MGVGLEQWDDIELRQKIYRIRIDYESLMTVELTNFDKLMIESPPDGKTPLADKLLDLQTIVLRIEEQSAARKVELTNKQEGKDG